MRTQRYNIDGTRVNGEPYMSSAGSLAEAVIDAREEALRSQSQFIVTRCSDHRSECVRVVDMFGKVWKLDRRFSK